MGRFTRFGGLQSHQDRVTLARSCALGPPNTRSGRAHVLSCVVVFLNSRVSGPCVVQLAGPIPPIHTVFIFKSLLFID